jgi:glucosamine 6-phosphate synthetase-like amidotransferase/phosphosugar isomerase protein
VCGICGYIGQSVDQNVTYQLMTHLFEKTEVRGEDAAGIWGPANDGEVLYHKEPCKSSIFVKRPFWKSLADHSPDLMLCHARAASMGVGVPSVNRNNHPFISWDGTIGLVHNGRIPDTEYRALKKRYPTTSACDSEIVLRIFEAGKFADEDRTKEFEPYGLVSQGLTGMKDIWSYLSLGHMAVAIGETQNDNRRLWLFRNKHRSLWLADMRSQLGQVFFFSAPQIWREAVENYEKAHHCN